MPKPNWFYKNRTQRSQWIAERFSDELGQCTKVLDVGCHLSALKNFLSDRVAYTGIDISGNPDITLNLDKVERLPLDELSFDAVICADVLEHLENIHHIFDELCRVTRRHLIITLPNPAYGLWRYLLKLNYASSGNQKLEFGKFLRYYGLPLEKPDDRHRWFYGYDEAIEFISYRAKKNNLYVKKIENNLMYEKTNPIRMIGSIVLKRVNVNLCYRTLIMLLEKRNDDPKLCPSRNML